MQEKVIKRYVIGEKVELVKTTTRSCIVFKEIYTHKDYYAWKNKNITIINKFFKD